MRYDSRRDDFEDGMIVQNDLSHTAQGSMVDISGYRPSKRAVLQVARDFEETYVDLNYAVIQMDAAHNLARRASLCAASTHAFADQLSALVPSAQGTLGQILEEQSADTVDILRNWRRKSR